jgi:hypothetical protein
METYLPNLSASRIVSGRFLFKVSGNVKDISPDRRDIPPNTTKGSISRVVPLSDSL